MWYKFFSKFRNQSLEEHCEPYRKLAIDKLNLPEGSQILNLPCGTGASLEGLLPMVGSEGFLVGIDSSEDVLKKANERLNKANTERVLLKKSSISDIGPRWVDNLMGGRKFDGIFCSLGLTSQLDWEKSFETLFSLLREGGRFVVMDVYNNSRDAHARVAGLEQKFDLTRRVWLPLKQRCTNFSREVVSNDKSKFGGELYIASGTKLNAEQSLGCDNSGWNLPNW